MTLLHVLLRPLLVLNVQYKFAMSPHFELLLLLLILLLNPTLSAIWAAITPTMNDDDARPWSPVPPTTTSSSSTSTTMPTTTSTTPPPPVGSREAGATTPRREGRRRAALCTCYLRNGGEGTGDVVGACWGLWQLLTVSRLGAIHETTNFGGKEVTLDFFH